MPHRALPATAGLLIALCAALPATAQQDEAAPTAPRFGEDVPPAQAGTLATQGERRRVLVFSVLFGAQSRPAYVGAGENEAAPAIRPSGFALDLGRLRVGDPERVLADDPRRRSAGFGLSPSFRVVPERDGDDLPDGLGEIDPTLEVGAQLGYTWPNAEAFGRLRYGIGGSEAWVGEVGADVVARPVDRLALRVGPRLLFGTDGYADTYFGVSAEEAAASGLSEYDPDGGLVSAGVEVVGTWRLADRWWLEGRARWDRFEDDAADSPVVEDGAREQGTLSIGLRRAFVLEF